MDNDITYKTILNSIIPNKIFDDMACEACATKFTLFKRKVNNFSKQCKDCLRFFCTDCVIRRGDRVLSCDNCSMLSRRPLIKSQVLAMKSKDLKQYLIAKKVSLRGCVEKEDLVNILMRYANGESQIDTELLTNNVSQPLSRPQERYNTPPGSPARRSRSPPVNLRQTVESPQSEHQPDFSSRNHNVDIEEISSEEDISPMQGPEPLITEQEQEFEQVQQVQTELEQDEERDEEIEIQEEQNRSQDNSDNSNQSVFNELSSWTGNVKLSDIMGRSDLEYLNVKQLKDLLRSNRVDFKGCLERSELLDRASRLWDAHKRSREDLNAEGLYDESLCKICWDSPIECVILECGHMACCINCGKQMNECPICRQYVVRVVRFFKA
ncbi:E3 ubiquitin-protein ligase RNF34 isoform X3 [Microplitis mediator]|uniref:E3 ubiquitin-protein ligase RNF34 isoform X3 n=1 Tax=Microplitis mediator TaxID=375433 RepID=UPI002556E300|nr:E3 ubiquitin-protein ligase RNF34 isoform X3 [Microplitis mediator]